MIYESESYNNKNDIIIDYHRHPPTTPENIRLLVLLIIIFFLYYTIKILSKYPNPTHYNIIICMTSHLPIPSRQLYFPTNTHYRTDPHAHTLLCCVGFLSFLETPTVPTKAAFYLA